MPEKRNRRGQEHYSRHRREKKKHIAGKIIAVLQLLVSVIFVGILYNSGMIPNKYLLAGSAVLLVLFAVTFGMQYIQNKTHVIGTILSILVSVALAVGAYYFINVHQTISNIGGASYKTDNMIVVVRKEDSAQSILDASDYIFGIQTSADQSNNEKMVKKVTTIIGKEPNVKEFATIQEEAQALLDGRIDAAIYNEAFNGLIADEIEGYSDNIRVLYQYGIDTKLKKVDQSVTEPFNVYISGIDVYGPVSTNSRSDVNIIATVNPQTKQVLLTTTPRDYYVPIPEISGGQKDKLTHAGIYGVDASMATLEELYHTDINYYARVNFTSLIKIVDTIGGIDVNSEYAFEAGGYSFKKGMNHMNGKQALAFSRERHSFASGDNQRGKNQEAVITAIINKMLTPSMLTKTLDIMAELQDSVQTNVTTDQISKLIQMQLNEGGSWSIISMNAVGTGDVQPCYSSGSQLLYVMHPNDVSVNSISDKINRILGGEKITQ
nr:LCP family protein [uncultured Sellimonas sp.]